MFSSNVCYLPSCNTYERAVQVWERRPTPRSKNWPVGTRPLEDTRKTHYAVIRDGDKIVFRLHQTNVVEWHNANSFTLDSNYDSISTRNFAERFIPEEVGFLSMKENGYVVTLGEQRFLRGRHTFEKGVNFPWVCVSETIKPTRQVLHPVKMREVQAATKDTREWVKAIWAISGNNGHHPWVGKKREATTKRHYSLADIQDPLLREEFVCSLIPRHWPQTYVPFDASKLITKINEYFYNLLYCYIRIDYDAPIPRN